MDFKATQNKYIEQINIGINQYVPCSTTEPKGLHEAINYALQAGGKRLRPMLVLAAFEACKKNHLNPLPAAVAVECIHTYSLIHDDLPCMDDAELRRGKPSLHVQFAESTALLAGDALLTYAFELLAAHYPEKCARLVGVLASAAGSRHLIGGQFNDLNSSQSHTLDEMVLLDIYMNKTAALIAASLQMGAILGESSSEEVLVFRDIGYALGLTFQIVDDILDETASEGVLGKPVAQAICNDTLTYPAVYGVATSREKAQFYTQKALILCKEIKKDTEFIECLINSLLNRIY